MASSKAGAKEVVHVDASKGMINWAKENMLLNNLENNNIRFIVDDCIKFVEKEARRKRFYQGIIMDPPLYGRGPNGNIWKLEDNLYELILKVLDILDDKPLFFIINIYNSSLTVESLKNIMKKTLEEKLIDGIIEVDEIGLPILNSNLILPCGITGRWYKK